MGEQNAAYLEKINRAAAAIEAACGGAGHEQHLLHQRHRPAG